MWRQHALRLAGAGGTGRPSSVRVGCASEAGWRGCDTREDAADGSVGCSLVARQPAVNDDTLMP